jgi:hypothetical protein
MKTNVEKLNLPPDKKLYAWQEEFINTQNKDRVLLCAEAGCGKTITAICWLKLRPQAKALVIAPVGIQLKWKNDLKEWGAEADVVSTDTIKKMDLNNYGAIIADECQNINSALFDKTRSQRATVFYNYVRSHPNAMIFLSSATPIRSKPENLHTLACYLNIYWKIQDFREEFTHLTDLYGRLHREANKDWRIKIRPKLEQVAHIVNMRDCVDVPVHEHLVKEIKWNKTNENKLKEQYLEPAKEWHTRHRLEQSKEKWEEVQKIIDGNRKVVLVCYYLDQIADYVKRIGDDRQVFVVTGATKNQGQVVKDANESKDCILIIQSSLGAGFDLDSFSVMVFCSLGFAFVSLVQMQARINRIHNLHKNQYIYLLGGKCDRGVKEQLDLGLDFHPPAYYNKQNANPEHTNDYVTSAPATKEETGSKDNTLSREILLGEVPF